MMCGNMFSYEYALSMLTLFHISTFPHITPADVRLKSSISLYSEKIGKLWRCDNSASLCIFYLKFYCDIIATFKIFEYLCNL